MSAASARGWGNPGRPGSQAGHLYEHDHIVTVTAAGIRLRVHHAIAPLVVGFCAGLAARGYALDKVADDWGYAHRDIRGRPGVLSNHSWGLAIDLNATKNPMTGDGHNHTDMPPWVPPLGKSYGFSWGGDYKGSRRDPMHFEFLGTPADAAVLIAKHAKPPKQ